MSTRKAEKSPKKRTPQFIIWYLYGGIDGKGFWSIDLPEQYASRLAAQNAVDAYVGRKPRFAKYYKVVEVKS